ncbi:unnamed protein product [Schistosoma margrebowiei]|uniref:Uncharacterized protein n=1 Tax=Schistosoma margrebowiei TaxID=48269 RepID=A0A183LVX4_9TREM|nr:unnamed protein product [Schistosoma margrebowiei]
MVFEGSRQETLDPGFVLLGTRQQGVPVILKELVLPGGFGYITRIYIYQLELTIVINWDFYEYTYQQILDYIKKSQSSNDF